MKISFKDPGVAASMPPVGQPELYGRGQPRAARPTAAAPPSPARPAQPSTPVSAPTSGVSPAYSDGGTNTEAYTPFDAGAAEVMREAAAESAFDAHCSMLADSSDADMIVPVTKWHDMAAPPKRAGRRLPGGLRALTVELALYDGETPSEGLLAAIGHALRADSPDAPATHAEAVKAGEIRLDEGRA